MVSHYSHRYLSCKLSQYLCTQYYSVRVRLSFDVLVLQLVLVMSVDNFKFLRGQYNEYNHKMLIKGSWMVVVSSKSVQWNWRYSIANQTGYKKFLPEIYNWSNWWVWSKFWSSEYDYFYFWNCWTDLYQTKAIVWFMICSIHVKGDLQWRPMHCLLYLPNSD